MVVRLFRLLVWRSGTRCQMNSEIQRVMSTASNSSLKQSCSALTSVTSALEVIFNVMHSINPRFTYFLLTYLPVCHVYGCDCRCVRFWYVCSVALVVIISLQTICAGRHQLMSYSSILGNYVHFLLQRKKVVFLPLAVCLYYSKGYKGVLMKFGVILAWKVRILAFSFHCGSKSGDPYPYFAPICHPCNAFSMGEGEHYFSILQSLSDGILD